MHYYAETGHSHPPNRLNLWITLMFRIFFGVTNVEGMHSHDTNSLSRTWAILRKFLSMKYFKHKNVLDNFVRMYNSCIAQTLFVTMKFYQN